VTKLIAMIDGSIYSQSVCDHAAWVAVRTAAAIEILHVLGRRDVASAPADLSGSLDADARDLLLQELASLDEQKAKLSQKRGRLILEQAKQSLQKAGVSDVQTKLRHGDIVETVQEFETGADLIIIGKRGEAADFAKLHLGSNLERIVRTSRTPVLVASRAFRPINRFLIAFDGGPSVTKAIQHIAKGALFRGIECRLLMVGKETIDTRAHLEDAATLLRSNGYAVQTAIEPGQPDSVISTKVEQDSIDLLVMGAYGHSRIRSLIIGSTTTEMIRSCKVPVLLFH
jgi:nucleotide-binding universal stress UspA family protein